MNDNNHIMTLPKRDLKTSSYKMNTNKKDLKRLSKSQLIKLLIKQEKNGQANEFENSVVPQQRQVESLPGKSINGYKDLIIEPPEQFRDKQKKQRPQNSLESHLHCQRTLSILMMKYSKPKTKALKNSKSLVYKADKIRNSKASRMNSKLKFLKNWMTLKRYITYSKNKLSRKKEKKA